jgi:hypothetical protein
MSGKPKKKEEDCSQNPSAISHRTKIQLYERVGFHEKKISLGQDALEKLAFLIRIQHGEYLDDKMVVSDVLSYCINACYNMPSLRAEVKKHGEPKVVKAAKTPEGQRLYRYYQMAQAGDALELVEAFNATDKRSRPYFPHITDFIKNLELNDLCLDDNSWEDVDGQEEGEDVTGWSPMTIQALNDHEEISIIINELNKKAFPHDEEA